MEPIVYYTPFRSNIIRKKKPDLDEISESVETRDSTIHFSVKLERKEERKGGGGLERKRIGRAGIDAA